MPFPFRCFLSARLSTLPLKQHQIYSVPRRYPLSNHHLELRGRRRPSPRYCMTTTSPEGNTTTPRPFRILGLQQVAIGHDDRDDLRRLWVDLLGIPVHQAEVRMERENVTEDILTLPDGIEIDLMTPIDAAASPKVHIPPLNHIGLWVEGDLAQAVEWLQSQGVRMAPGGIRIGAAGHKVAFVHPKANADFPVAGNGVLIELVEAPPKETVMKDRAKQQRRD